MVEAILETNEALSTTRNNIQAFENKSSLTTWQHEQWRNRKSIAMVRNLQLQIVNT